VRRTLHIVLLLVAVTVSCRGPKLIPREKLEDIYYDMLVTDQMLRDDADLRRQADTSLVYEAVFNRYGYDTDDYMYTVRNYLKDPERFAKSLEKVADRLHADANAVEKVVNYHDWVAKYMNQKRPPVDSVIAAFSRDSLFVGWARVERDASPYGGWFRLRGVKEDTLMVSADSLTARADSVAVDSVAVEEPVAEEKPVEKVSEPVKEQERVSPPARRHRQMDEKEVQMVEEEVLSEEEAQ